MWTKDLINELIRSVQELPERISEKIAESLSRMGHAGTTPGNGPNGNGPRYTFIDAPGGVAEAAASMPKGNGWQYGAGQTAAAAGMASVARSAKEAAESLSSVSAAWKRMEQEASARVTEDAGRAGPSWEALASAGRAATRSRWQRAVSSAPAPSGLFARLTPAFLHRYQQYGTLGPEDTLANFLDQNPAIRELAFMGMAAGGPRLLSRMPGLPVLARQMGMVAPRARVLSSTVGTSGLPALLAGGGAGGMGGGGITVAGGGALGGPGGGFNIVRAGQNLPQQIGQAAGTAMARHVIRLNLPGAPGVVGISPLGGVAIGAAALAGATIIPHWIRRKAEDILEQNRPYAQTSPGMARVFADYDARNFIRDIRIGQATYRTAGTLAAATGELKDSLVWQDTTWQNIKNNFGTVLAKTGQGIAEASEPALKTLKFVGEHLIPGGGLLTSETGSGVYRLMSLLGVPGKIMLGNTSAAAQDIKNAINGPPKQMGWMDFIRDVAHRKVNKLPIPLDNRPEPR